MEDYPQNLKEFDVRFRSEEACREYLLQLRWPDGFRFRFNRRRSKSRGKLFFRLVQQALAIEPVPLDRMLHPGAKVKLKPQSVGAG